MEVKDRMVNVPLDVVVALFNGCLSTVRLAADGWEPGDEHAAQVGIDKTPVWLRDQIEAHEEQHYQYPKDPTKCGKCGGPWPCDLAETT